MWLCKINAFRAGHVCVLDGRFLTIRSKFISNLVLYALKFKKLLRNFAEPVRTKLWPKIKKLLLIGLEPRFLLENVHLFGSQDRIAYQNCYIKSCMIANTYKGVINLL